MPDREVKMIGDQLEITAKARRRRENMGRNCSTLRLSVSAVKCFDAPDLNGDGEFSVLDIDLSREMHA